LNFDFFGPHVKAEVTVKNGSAEKLKVFSPKHKDRYIEMMICDWGEEIKGSDADIKKVFEYALNGAQVIIV